MTKDYPLFDLLAEKGRPVGWPFSHRNELLRRAFQLLPLRIA
jgi:hypothetical protein